MASTGINNGTLISVFVNGVAIAYCTSHKMDFTQGTRDASNKSSGGYKEILPAQRSWSIDFEALFAENASYGFTQLHGLIDNRTAVTLVWSSGVTGDYKYTGTAYLTKLSMDAKNEDNQTYSGTFEGSGPITPATV
ncbi:MAG: phage tail tube protein [Cytophagaceae bacterium]|jgi:predicted secreted protein